MTMEKDIKPESIIYVKVLLRIITLLSNRKYIDDRLIDSHIKRYEEIRKLITGQGEDNTTGCLLDYEYIKNHYRLMAVDLSRQKELDADPKSI